MERVLVKPGTLFIVDTTGYWKGSIKKRFLMVNRVGYFSGYFLLFPFVGGRGQVPKAPPEAAFPRGWK